MENNDLVVPKKNNSMVVVVILIIIALIAVVIVKNKNKIIAPAEKVLTNTELDLNKAVMSDDTTSIINSIDSIKIEDTSLTDLQEVDNELKNL